jgi:hypothetical protein
LQENAVSPLWNDQLRVGLCPDRLIVAGYRRGLRPRLQRAEIVPVPPLAFGEPWRAATAALPRALAPSIRDRPEITVILSNHFVRYELLPWSAEPKSEADWLERARARMVRVYGAPAETWALVVTATSPGGPRVVSAVEEPLLDEVEARVIAAGARLTGIQPHLMTVYKRLRPPVGDRSCWLVIDEPGRATVALIRRGAWHAIRSLALEGGRAMSLADLLEGESAILGLDRPCTQVYLHTTDSLDASRPGRYEVRDVTLAADAAVRDRQLAMAMG